jgi:anti-sigma factor RsiW
LNRCAETRLIPRLARGDLDAAEERRLRQHAAGCAECTAELAAEEGLTQRLRTGIARPQAPPELKAAIERMMSRRAASAIPSRKSRRRAFAAAAAAALVVVATMFALRNLSRQDPLARLAREAAATHESIGAQRDALQRETPDTTRLRDLTQRHGLPAATAFQGDEEVRLVSVREGRVQGKVSAVLVYVDTRGRLVTLEMLPGGNVTIPPERTRAIQQFHPMLTRADRLGVALWKQGATLYLLTAPIDEEELAKLYLKVRTHTS